MSAPYRHCALALLLALSAVVPACRRHEPPALVAKDLGTPDRPLPPTPMARYDLTGLKGKATPQRAADGDEEPAEPGHSDGDTGTDGISQDDRDLIDELIELANEALIDRNFGDLVELTVPQQREVAEALFEQFGQLLGAVENLGTALEAKAPGSGAMLSKQLAAQLAQPTTITDLHRLGPEKLAATTNQGRPIQFWLIDDEWFTYDPDLPDDESQAAELTSAFGQAVEKINELSSKLEAGDLDAAALGPQLVMIMTEMQARMAALIPGADPASDEESDEAGQNTDQDAESNGADDGADDRSGPTDIG